MEVNTAQGNPLGWTPPEWVTAAGTKPECQEQRKVELPDLRNKKIHELVLKLNSFDPKNLPEDAMAFYIKFQIVGYINKRVAPDLPKEFKITHTEIYLNEKVEESMNAAISIMKNQLIEKYPMLKGWRNEEYSIWSENGPVASLDRSASSIFGIRTYGTHLNAYTKDPETNLIKMWVAKRSQTKQTFPGFLDNMAAGGMGIGQKQLGPRENMIKEAYEEAGVSPELMKNAKLAGQVSNYECRQDGCFQPSTNFVFDLEVPKDFVPRITDGEVESFEMWDMDQVRMRIKEFKPEAALVIVDFLIRHGLLTLNNLEGYIETCSLLKREIPLPAIKLP
jgi:8-oxo-dGTP pyrophosphatase MutT (NUDIX family)